MKSIEIHQNIALRLLTHIFLSIIDLFRYFLMRFWSVFCWINQSFLWSHCTISHYSFFDCLDGNKLISKGVLLQPVVLSDLLYHWEFLKVDRKGSNLHIDFIKISLMKSVHFLKGDGGLFFSKFKIYSMISWEESYLFTSFLSARIGGNFKFLLCV